MPTRIWFKATVGIGLNVKIVKIICHMVCGTFIGISREITKMLRSNNISKHGSEFSIGV